jgi:predicted dehydrogenase
MSRDRGRIVVVGACPIEIPRSEMYMKELKVLMSRAYGPGSYDAAYEKRGIDYPLPFVRWTENRNMEEVLRLMAVGKVDVKPLISHEYRLEDAPKAYETIMSGQGRTSLAVVLRYPVNDVEDPIASYAPRRRITVTGSEATKGEIRFALVGAGNLAKWAHLPALKKISGARLHAVYSAHGARGKAYALRFGAGYHTSDLQEILKDDAVDVVLIASRHKDHAAQAIAALQAGKHVFIEKPMAITIDECQAIARAVKESGRQLAVGFNRRYAPFYVEMKRHLKGRTGPAVVAVRMNSPGIENGWAADAGQGGVVLGEGCHFVDLMYWLLESEPVSVSAHGFDRHNITASIKFADGSIGALVYTVVGSDASGGELVEAFAPGIGVTAEDFKRLAVKKKSRRQQSRWFARKGYTAQLDCFVKSLRDGKPTDVTVRDGARATLGCLLAMQSAQSGQPQVFDLDAVLAE